MRATTTDGGTAYDSAPEGGWTIKSVAPELLRCKDGRIERPPITH